MSIIVEKVVNAIDGVYHANPSKEDKDLALLVLKLGGPSLLDILFKANVLPSTHLSYKMAKKLVKFRSPVTWSVTQCIQNNIPDKFF